MVTDTLTCNLRGYSGTATTASVALQSFDQRERVRRALRGLAAFWAAAIGSIFIPVAHFLLVPGFALFGVYTLFERLGARQVVTEAHGTCPDCGKEQKLEIGGRWRVPRDITCVFCQRSLRLS